ncbi:hypothetical protein POM88_009974 [Heracleum sosnowskyi]|uniref:Uncharacterized protein n=1 Tax=Heracleum sosnowskyi TaxID=360622 RepID=A0AAD8N8X6_9APIA|nr:hypothetical protein POM88_009974 [Heracleum sosnowskyi]
MRDMTYAHMREARETITLLAGVATLNTLYKTIFNAVKRGEVVALAALLLVARDKVLGVSFCGSMTSPGFIRKAIMNKLAALINRDSTMILKMCLEKEELMIYILQMLEIFNRAGSELDLLFKNKQILVCCQMNMFLVMNMFKKAYFTLSDQDTDTSDIIDSSSWRKQSYAAMEQQGYSTFLLNLLCCNVITLSKTIVRSGSVLMAALRRGVRGV